MKKLIIAAALAIGCAGAATNSNAQVHLSVNIGSPVANTSWYNTDDNYYYLPEQGVYYNTTRRVYVYQDNGNWVYASRLPARYNGYTYRRSHYVKVRERAPFTHHQEYSSHFNNNYRGKHVEWRRDNDRHDNNHGNKRGNHYGRR